MKRSSFTKPWKHTLLAVPAAALMLGAAQAGTTVGLNFQAWYYDSGTTPQTVGYGTGYQTTGFPVTAKAFGVAPANWYNTDPQNCQAPIAGTASFFGLTANFTAANAWMSGIGELNAGFNASPGLAEAVAPGNNEATWGYLDDGNSTAQAPAVSLAGLAAVFPHGYVVQTLAAEAGKVTFAPIDFTDGVSTNTVAYSTYYVANNAGVNPDVPGGTVGLSAPSGVFTSDTFNINCHIKSSSNRSTLAGFIITDQPVITEDPTNTTANQGSTLNLSLTTLALTNGLGFQWQLNGVNIPGATNAAYVKNGVTTAADQGNYDVVVTNLFGSATSEVAVVTIVAVASIATDLSGVTNTVYAGASFSGWSVVASGGLPLSFQWYKNGGALSGQTNATLYLTNLATTASGGYSVTVANSFGSAKSSTNHLIVLASPDIYVTDVAQSAPSAFWPLNEAAGASVAVDYSGFGHNATNMGGVTAGVAGPMPPAQLGFSASQTAYQFDGGSGYISCGTGPSLAGTTDFTVEAWINTTATAAGVIIQQRSPTGYNGEYQLEVTANGAVSVPVLYGGGYQFNGLTTTRAVNDGNWHYVAFVRSGSTGTIYIDGTVAATGSGTVAPLDPTIATYIGADARGSSTYFSGTIADVAIYSYALSSHTVSLHAYNGQSGNMPFSVSIVPGGFVADSKPAGTLHPGANHGVLWTNSITDGSSLTRTGVAVFTGNSQIATPADPDFNTTNGTIMFWMQANAPITGAGTEGAMLFDRRTTNGAVIVLHDDGTIFWQQGGSADAFSTGYVPDGNWHHIAVTFGQTTNDTLSIYIDGSLSASVPVTTAWSWPAAQELEVGKSHDGYWQAFTGFLDDFRYYGRQLSPTEIASVYASDALVDTTTLKVRYNFDTTGVGSSITWPVGSLYSSPTLGTGAVWTPLTNATPPYPFTAPGVPLTGASLFYRAGF